MLGLLAIPTLAVTSAAASPAESTDETLSVYWTYWSAAANGTWSYVEQGAGATTPPDGTSQGWRYGTGSTPTYTEAPRTAADFEHACASTPIATGKKRVAVVVDFGTSAEAPAGQTPPAQMISCASVPAAANGLQVLSAVTATRQSPDGMMCGISGYPSQGCVQQLPLSTLTATTSAPTDVVNTSGASQPSGSWGPFAFGTIVVAILVASAVVVSRRRSVSKNANK
ncbi:MAG: SCO2322 family protein [Actinomycetes bacterium]